MPPFGQVNEIVKIKIGSHEIAKTKHDKLLGVHSELSFDYHISEICRKAKHELL